MTQIEPDVALGERYESTRVLTERLAAPLTAEDQTVQSMPDVSPTKWHRAHTSWFFETFLLEAHLSGFRPFHPEYPFLFNSYYESVGPRYPRAERGLVTRPGIEEIASYRRHVDESMATLLADPAAIEKLHPLIELGVQHEQQHQELLLMDIKHVLSRSPLHPAYLSTSDVAAPTPSRPAPTPDLTWIEHPGGLADIGSDGADFAFDNELPRHTAHLVPFALANRPVTNGDWLAFMADGGYDRPELWLSEGWATVNAERWRAPLYWHASDGDRSDWQVFTLAGSRPVDANEPVCHISYFEADAFAHWTGYRLPTEAEWETVAGPHLPVAGTFDLDALHPRLAGPAPHVGHVWEWTASPYTPYPGFRAAPGAVGEYNGKFMVNQQVLRGGCAVTPPGHARSSYRNFFPASARWVFSGVRLARDLEGTQ